MLKTLETGHELEALEDNATAYVMESKSQNTVRAYRADWADFQSWCGSHGMSALPALPATVATYLAWLAQQGLKAGTIQRRVTAISQAHKAANCESPTSRQAVRAVLAGIRRVHGSHQEGKHPITTGDMLSMLAALPDTLSGLRDKALLLVGFAGAFRRSELVALDVESISFVGQGLIVELKHSKTDQAGYGRKVAIPIGSHAETCPVRTLKQWLEAASVSSGPVFRSIDRHGNVSANRLSDKSVALIVKRAAQAVGLDPALYSGHSLRAGFATSAAAAGAEERSIMDQTGHRSVQMVRRYIRLGTLFGDNAAGYLGL